MLKDPTTAAPVSLATQLLVIIGREIPLVWENDVAAALGYKSLSALRRDLDHRKLVDFQELLAGCVAIAGRLLS